MRAEKLSDKQYQEYTIEKVRGSQKDGWEITFDGAWCFGVPADSPIKPKVGMVVRQYSRGVGHPIRGMDIDGVEVYYRTEAEDDERLRLQAEAAKRKRRKEYEEKREEYEQRVNALPDVFTRRIIKFRQANPEFRYEFEPYELFTCEEAVKIAEHCKTEEGIRAFHKLPYEKQKPVISDGHSGNTFGMACRLAMWYVSHPEQVAKEHGALVALVGCDEYGCRH